MTLIISALFLSALAMSAFAIWVTVDNAMLRINAVIAEEFGPAIHQERRITFGKVIQRRTVRSADVIALRPILLKQELKLAA